MLATAVIHPTFLTSGVRALTSRLNPFQPPVVPTMAQRGQRWVGGSREAGAISGPPWTLPLCLVFALWGSVLCDPQIWLGASGVSFPPGGVLGRYGALCAPVVPP